MTTNDTLDRKWELKKFLKLVFDGIDFKEECVGIIFINRKRKINKQYKFRDIDLLVDSVFNSKLLKTCNCYFYTCSFKALSSGYEDKDIAYKYCVGLDFDRKDYCSLTLNDAIDKFKKSKLSYHAIVDSGNGYHIYSCINKTNNFDILNVVNKELQKITSCDARAIHTNQLLRLPTTFNTKGLEVSGDYNDRLYVNPLFIQNRHDKKFKRYDIEDLYNWFCNKPKLELGDGKYVLSGDRGRPFCLDMKLKNGTKENRNKDMLNMVSYLKENERKSKEEIREIMQEWAIKSDYIDEFNRKLDYAYDNWTFFFDCKECQYKSKCNFLLKSKQVGLWERDENYKIEDYDFMFWKRSLKSMNGNELLIVAILYSDRDIKPAGMNRDEIKKELTHKKKVRLSDKTLGNALNSLAEKGYIEIKSGNARAGIKDMYKLSNKFLKDKGDNIQISNLAISMCVCNNISTEELKLYYVMRILHEKEEREDKATYAGSYLCMTQKEIAKEYKKFGGNTDAQSNISVMIKNLCECRMMKVIGKRTSEKTNYEYNIYKLYC